MEVTDPNNTLVIYRSSAGSGKTYTLTREYLYLALRGGDRRAYRRILAVTFTNKAMQEMKDRIIHKLDEFASGNVTDNMAVELISRLNWKEDQFTSACENLLSSILHQYSHFAITTIDAFFQQIIRSFARELHISGGYRLELEQELVYRQVIQELMNEADTNKFVRRWLEDFSLSKLDSAKGWEVEREMLDFIKQLDSESFREIEEEVIKYETSLYREIRDTCQEIMHRFENTLAQKAGMIISRIEACGLEKKNFFRGHAANFFYNVLSGIYRNDTSKEMTATFLNCMERGEWFKKNLSPELEAKKEQLYSTDFQQLAGEIHDFWNAGIQNYRTAQAVYQNIYVFALSVSLLKKLSEYKQDNDILFISDATRLIRELVRNTDAPFIYEKVGSFFDHFLIDEFQDTSRFQWESFRPLVADSLAQGKANMIVGDVKQSIYRWRGGDLQLLQNEVENEFIRYNPKGENLDTNYRSRKNIINFNNAVFSQIQQVLEKSFNSKLADPVFSISDFLDAVYDDVEQKFPGSESGTNGYVEGRVFEGSDAFKEGVYDALIEIIQKLQDSGVPLREIAILVRDNREGKEIAEFLMKYDSDNTGSAYKYDVVSNETLHLSASAGVRAIMATLRYIEDPSDAVARAALLFHQQRLSADQNLNLFLNYDIALHDFLDEVSGLKKLPLYSIVEHLVPLLGLEERLWELPYVQTLQDHILAYMKREKGDIAGFLQLWDDKLNKESIKVADDLDAIRILTIHKSKGLEFHSVILPFLNWEWNRSKGVNWFTLDGFSLESPKLVPVSYTSRLDQTLFSADYQAEVFRHYLDNLNLLYVAFTRARHDLWFMIEKTRSKSLNTVSGVLLRLFENATFSLSSQFDTGTGVFSYGNSSFIYADSGHDVGSTVHLDRYPTYDWQISLKLRPVPERIRSEDRQVSISTGLLAHEILSRVKYIDDIRDALDDIKFTMGINENDFETLRQKLRGALRNPEVREWFNHDWEVRNEQGIFASGEEFRPDRIIHRKGETLVIDYKTGAERKSHLDQMKQYLGLVRQLYSGEAEGRILYLEEMKIVKVR